MQLDEGTVVTNVDSGQPMLRRLRLRVSKGPDQGLARELGLGTLLCGSHPDTDFRLSDPRVSRRHCELSVTGDGLRVVDLDSKNGVWVQGDRVADSVVGPGAVLVVGDSQIVVEAVEAPLDLGGLAAFGPLATRSPAMQRIFGLLARVASSDATVLLEGETGVGKDVLARTLHAQSPRKSGPFVVFDCASVSANLIAGELFGHKKGAFTGADRDRAGVFEAARGGTVFLDEIGELSLELQPSLLRVLEGRQVRRVGENMARDVDVRVVAATNRDLREEVKARRFREDLFFRLAIVRVAVPPLRERREDVELLARRFLVEFGRAADDLSAAELARLVAHDWPGNVRELKNVIEQSAALATREFKITGGPAFAPVTLEHRALTGGVRRPDALPAGPTLDDLPRQDLPVPSATSPPPSGHPHEGLLDIPFKDARQEAIERFERAYVDHLLGVHRGNVSGAAREAGIDRNYLYRLMKKYGIEQDMYR